MDVFISSLIRDMTAYRSAARRAVESLGHRPVLAEDFGALPTSPQVACLRGLRQSEVVVLILGNEYGAVQPSGLSATHEEYREARDRKPVLAFVQRGGSTEAQQQAFIAEVQGWASGLFRGEFGTPDELGAGITRALHEWEMSRAVGPLDPSELLRRATELIPEREAFSEPRIVVTVAAGPTQPVLRPAEVEDPAFGQALLQQALFGPLPLFDAKRGSTTELTGHALVCRQIAQSRGAAWLSVSEQGDLVFSLPLSGARGALPVILEEDVAARLHSAIAYAAWVYDRIDSTHRLTHVALAATIGGADYFGWRTHAEHAAQPNTLSAPGRRPEARSVIHLSPGHRVRAALTHDAVRLQDDLLVLLRRQYKA